MELINYQTRKPVITTKCVCAVMLTETRGALHGAQIPEIPGAGRFRVTRAESKRNALLLTTGSHRRRGVWRNPGSRLALQEVDIQPGATYVQPSLIISAEPRADSMAVSLS
jgi:hypothetical protein